MHTAPRVLLVDDDQTFPILLRRLLAKVPGTPFGMDWEASYEGGLAALLENRHQVCLLDYRLGFRTGLDLLRDATAQGVRIPIIILTAADDPKVDLEATELGAADFLLKDKLDPVILERVIRYSVQQADTLQALQKSHERFRLLFERSLDAILISNDRQQFVEVNSAACRLLGLSRKQLLEWTWGDVLARSVHQQTGARPEARGELSFTHPGGSRIFIEYSSTQLAPDLNLSILRDVTERCRLEDEIQEISEREQRRLGQDLHDGLGQSLTGIAFLAKVLHQKLRDKSAEEAPAAANIATLINQALTQIRRLSRGLCPVVLDTNDIHAALEQLAENLRALFSVTCRLRCDPDVVIADNTVAVQLYRIVQEAATNAVKHGNAKNISLSLTLRNSRLVLKIKDDGIGFPPSAPGSTGIGLPIMRHRARMIGATISVRQSKQGGITVTCSLPKPATPRKNPAPG